jgi:hypothetical protein
MALFQGQVAVHSLVNVQELIRLELQDQMGGHGFCDRTQVVNQPVFLSAAENIAFALFAKADGQLVVGGKGVVFVDLIGHLGPQGIRIHILKLHTLDLGEIMRKLP